MLLFYLIGVPQGSTLFPYTTLFRSQRDSARGQRGWNGQPVGIAVALGGSPRRRGRAVPGREDRKSTRLNSSHVEISYAVFCLKKKTDGYKVVLDIVQTRGDQREGNH